MTPKARGAPPAVPTAPRSVVIHGHFYQPPREEPWLEEVEREPGAAPFHDWNERIEKECYRAVVAARIPGPGGRIARLVNTLERISFNVGPTLIEWLEVKAPDTWNAMLAADRASHERLGHGNAIAMPYHHIILPLASRRDKTTEVRWGIADFRRRFGRDPEGMWLPETAVDDETLDVLAAEGIRFTVLAPHQVTHPAPNGLPGRYTTEQGRTIALFPYEGALSHDVAFGQLIRDAGAWARRVIAVPATGPGPLLVSMAADGETFGHHHAFGEMALASVLDRLNARADVRVENFAFFLSRHPPAHDVGLVAPSAWSCPHGVQRWRGDCGCRTRPGTSQAWRAPLREALDRLAGALHRVFEEEGAPLLGDPWAARDGHGEAPAANLPTRARELLEMERNALRMFTSCGWFFDDVGGIETVIILRYAARAIELAGAGGADFEEELRGRLAAAVSNDPAIGTGREVYDTRARAAHPGHVRAVAGYAAVRAVAPGPARSDIGVYRVEPDGEGTCRVSHSRTGRVWRAATAVRGTRRLDFRVDVEPDGEPPHTVPLGHLPEPEHDRVRDALRAGLRTGIIGPEEERLILDGRRSYAEVLADVLTRQLPADPARSDGLDLDRLDRTLDLFELEEQHIPFDAQTRFYRLLTAGPVALRRLLEPLAPRLGFALEEGTRKGGA